MSVASGRERPVKSKKNYIFVINDVSYEVSEFTTEMHGGTKIPTPEPTD
jgi:cytochrome b involved in lipid metabolism